MAASALTESMRALVCRSQVVFEGWGFRAILQDTVDGGGKLTVRSLRQTDIYGPQFAKKLGSVLRPSIN